MKKVRVVPDDPNWPNEFEAEARAIADALGPNMLAIHHIGSTSIPGIYAKPVIDILVELADIADMDAKSPAMESLGYEVNGGVWHPRPALFPKGRRTRRADAPDPHV